MSEDISYALPEIAADADHLVHLVLPNGTERRYKVAGEAVAVRWSNTLRAATHGRVTWFALAPMGRIN